MDATFFIRVTSNNIPKIKTRIGSTVLNQTDNPLRRQRSLGSILLEFLGSMNLAITLLVAIAIASVIGTVLKQNEPYNTHP